MTISKKILVFCLFIFSAAAFCPTHAARTLGMRELGDSLMAYTGFSKVWSPIVRIKNLRIDDKTVTLHTNAILGHVRWTPENVEELKKRVSVWTLGEEDGEVSIFTNDKAIDSLITDCARGIGPTTRKKDLTDRNIALWPSHGLYYNIEREEWIWQRATLWTTVEDLYSQEYVRLIRKMLENAGATIYMPRAGVENQELGVSGLPQWAEGARYWLKSKGVRSGIWNLYDADEYKDDMKCRPTWVNSLKAPIDLCLAFHTDGQDSGNDTTIIGTLVIYTEKNDKGKKELKDGRNREKENRNLGDWIQTQVTEDLQHIAPEWVRRQLREANYCESRVPDVPSIILELLSHKNFADMKYGLDPNFRFASARAVYKGILRYLNGKSAVVQPLPVQQLSISTDGTLRWKARKDPWEPTAKATYYMVYVQENDGEWDAQQVDKKTEVKLELKRGVKYNYYVVAGNDGGLSLPSPMISAYLCERDKAPLALIIDGFDDVYGPEWFAETNYAGIVPGSFACEDGFSCAYIGPQWDFRRTSQWVNDDNCGWGACYRDHAGQLTIGNTHDWAAQHGRVLRKMRISYVSATAEMAKINRNYKFVDYVCGRQRQPFTENMQKQLTEYLSGGGNMLLSAENYSKIDQEWAEIFLHATFYAERTTRNGRISTPRHRLYNLQLEPNEDQIFSAKPEGLKPTEDAKRMAEYQDMRCGAAVGWEGVLTLDTITDASPEMLEQLAAYQTPKPNQPTSRTLVYGFPLEAVMEFDKIYRNAIEWITE